MKEKCPIGYSLVGILASLNPVDMANNPTVSRDRFKKVVRFLLSIKTLDEADSEEVIQQYDEFLDHIPAIVSLQFTSFNQYKVRVDTFLMEHMASPRSEKLQRTVKLLLIMSHGQATVGRGFSVNKEVECENMKEKTLVAQRLVYAYARQK